MNIAPLNDVALNDWYVAYVILRATLGQVQTVSALARWATLTSAQAMSMTQTLSANVDVTQNLMPSASATITQLLRANAGSFSYVNPLLGSKLARDIQLQVRR